jgi:hypothetical protein
MSNVLEALQGDFKLFLQALWQQLDLPSPTRAQYAIADYLQHGPKRLQIQAFRGVGKSWITGAFVLWTLFKDPEKKIMIISASKERADNMSIFLQKLIIETPWLNHLQPKSDDTTEVGRRPLEPDLFRCPMLTSPGSLCEVCGHYRSADWFACGLDDSRRH